MTNAEILKWFQQEWNLRMALDKRWVASGRKRIIIGHDPLIMRFDREARRILAELGKDEIRIPGFVLRLEWDEHSPPEGTLVFGYEPPDPRQLELNFRAMHLIRRES